MKAQNHLHLMSSQAESSMAGSQGHYTNSGKSRTSFLRFHETPTREQSPSLSQFSAESSPYGSEGPVTPIPRPLTSVARASFLSCTRPLHSDQVSLPPWKPRSCSEYALSGSHTFGSTRYESI